MSPIFKKRFRINTPIVYLEQIEVAAQIKERFRRAWSRFYKRATPLISPYRQERFDAFFRQIQRDGTDDRYCKRVTICLMNPVVGYGVFAKEDIAPYSTLHHYAGILKLDDQIDPDDDSTFSFTDLKHYSIDAMKAGNWTRFMNHGDEGEEATNVIPWEYYSKKSPHIVFTSGAYGIKKGDQLLYSYGESYWEEREGYVRFSP